MTNHPEAILDAMAASRATTLDLIDWVADEERTRRRPEPGFRPLLWHLAHIGVFEEWWLLMRLRDQPPINPRYQIVFDPIRTPREESENLPSRREIETYLEAVRGRVLDLYLTATPRHSTELVKDAETYILNLVLEHEYQHQETLAYLLQMLPLDCKRHPINTLPTPSASAERQSEMVRIEAGQFAPGSIKGFAYDNELPRHVVDVAEFQIGRYLVTNAQFLEFIESGGYERRESWSAAGWAWKQEHGIVAPLYWTRGEEWTVRGMFGESPANDSRPVSGISWYEADAYARFAGKRLPTEFEWEKAASPGNLSDSRSSFPWGDSPPDTTLCNFGGRHLGTTPIGAFPLGASRSGCLDLGGNVWEWTSSTFAGYPGFVANPYPEYSELWFDGDHRVLKGGSWMTRTPLLRTSFRNFFRPGTRFAFSGLRLAGD